MDVRIELADSESDELSVVHFADGAADGSVVDGVEVESGAVRFAAEGFSVYAIAGPEVEFEYLTEDGETLKVTVRFDEREILPEGAALDVSEVTYESDPEAYALRNERLADALFEEYGNVAITDVRYLNISIMVPGEPDGEAEPVWTEYEPVYPVEVRINYTEPMNTANPGEYTDYNDGSPKVVPDIGNHIVGVHYTETGAEILETVDEGTDEGISETVAHTDGFSEYDFAYIYQYEIIESKYDYSPSAIVVTPDMGLMAKAAGDEAIPAHYKTLTDNEDGMHKLSLTVTGDADTDNNTVSNANIIIVFDTSNSMINYYVPMENGARGSDNYDGSNSYVLYRDTSGTEATDGYTGTVYKRTEITDWWGRVTGYSYSEYTGQRYSKTIRRADASEKVLYDFAHALFKYKNIEDDPNTPDVDERKNIQAALITFNRTASTVQDWTSTETDITGKVSSTGNGGSKKLDNSSGTNWQAALQEAQELLETADSDPTFVVFITDGQPTQINTTPSNQYLTDGTPYVTAREVAIAVQQACAKTGTESHGALFSIYAYGTEADYLDDMMYYAYNNAAYNDDLEAAGQETIETEGYYNAGDTQALADAINDIFTKIVKTLGITGVSVHDGTTSQVVMTSGEISHLLEVDEPAGYEYWLSFNTTGDKFTMKDLVSGDNVEYTVSASGGNVTFSWTKGETSYSATYEGTYSNGVARVKWDKATPLYNYAPPAAVFTDPSVDWDLSGLGTLLDGVTYEVTFDVYPSQETLDYIADLQNEKIQYEDLDANIRDYLTPSGSGYVLATNTTASITYTDNRLDKPEPTSSDYVNPEPVKTSAVDSLAITKRWENNIDEPYCKGKVC